MRQYKCKHDFSYSHQEEENKIGSNGTMSTGNTLPRLIDVVICSKCGLILRTYKR